MLLRIFAGLVGRTARHLAGKVTVTVPELAEAMGKALEEMKALLRRQGLKVDLECGHVYCDRCPDDGYCSRFENGHCAVHRRTKPSRARRPVGRRHRR
jgi:hypothetical protein